MSAIVDVQTASANAASPRRESILDAAEACFARNGFHRTTMQDVAREAAMSPGNIYRYFASKDDMVVSLAEREAGRAQLLVAAHIDHDKRAALAAIVDAYFVLATRETAVLRLDIWSEVTRNPRFATMMDEQARQFRSWLFQTFAALASSRDCDLDALCDLTTTCLRGMLVNRAIAPDHDPAETAALLFAVIDATLAGTAPLAGFALPASRPVRD